MPKELTGKVKEEIIQYQMNYIKENAPSRIAGYKGLGELLKKGIMEYPSEISLIDKEADAFVMGEIQEKLGIKVRGRLLNSARIYFEISDKNKNPTNKQLVELYEKALASLKEHPSYFNIKDYGHSTHELLFAYLKENKLIID